MKSSHQISLDNGIAIFRDDNHLKDDHICLNKTEITFVNCYAMLTIVYPLLFHCEVLTCFRITVALIKTRGFEI